MKQTYIGVDIIEINRVRDAIDRWGDHFLQRIYTGSEIELCGGRAYSLAARFAGKEAAVKALHTAGQSIGWREVEILSEISGKPVIHLHGQAQKRARELGLAGLEISLSHSRENAVAFVIGIKEE